jgi:hypothetical protein
MLTALLVGLCSAMVGCSISPQPEPPLINRERIHLTSDGMSLTVTGDPEAVSPPGMETTVTVIGLDTPEDEMVIAVNDDGSFVAAPFVVFPMAPAPEVRIFATVDGVRTEPIDLVANPDGTMADAFRPLEDCLVVPPTLLMGEVSEEDIVVGQARIENNCIEPVILEFTVSREMTEFFPTLGSRGMIATVREGSSRNVGVTFEPEMGRGTGSREDIIFLQISGMDGMAGRRLFTVRGEVVP